MIRFLTFEMIHNKSNVGSTRLRVHNLVKYWPEAGIYKYGENPDVMIFQKVYMAGDYKFHQHFKGIKILDMCDPDWLDGMPVKETIDAVDGITVPTEELAEYLRQMTDKPIKVIPDRHDVETVTPGRWVHDGKAETAVWFGYKQNAALLQFAIPTLETLGLKLTVISNDDPMAWRWANDPETYRDKYSFVKYNPETIITDLSQHDICVLPQGSRPVDRFKSNNKTTMAWLAGLPVAIDGDQLRQFMDPEEREKESKDKMELVRKEYDVKKSIVELKDFIEELRHGRVSE